MSGELMAGEALPSLRKLAKELRVSVLTVTRAYNELADEGLVENVQGKGTFVMERGNELMKERARERIMDKLREVSIEAKAADISLLDHPLACSRKHTGNNHERFLAPQGTWPTLALSVTGLTKHYDSGFTLILRDLRPAVRLHHGLVGPNGAGITMHEPVKVTDAIGFAAMTVLTLVLLNTIVKLFLYRFSPYRAMAAIILSIGVIVGTVIGLRKALPEFEKTVEQLAISRHQAIALAAFLTIDVLALAFSSKISLHIYGSKDI